MDYIKINKWRKEMKNIFLLYVFISIPLLSLNASGFQKNFDQQHNESYYGYQLINILENQRKSEQNYKEIKDLFRKLFEFKTDESLEVIFEVTGYGDVFGNTYTPDELIEMIVEVIFELSQNISADYQRIKKYFNNGAACAILARLDKFKFYDDVTKYINEHINDPAKLEVTLSELWELSDLRDIRSIEFLKNYQSKDIREDVAIAGNYCMIPYEYEENLNYLLNYFLKYQREDRVTEFPVADLLVYIQKIRDPEVIPFLKNNRNKGLILDSILPSLDSTIKSLEKEESYIHRHHIRTYSSSILQDKEYGRLRYHSDNILDKNMRTSWVEGAEGNGLGEWFQFDFDQKFVVEGFDILSGYTKSKKIFFINNRIKKAELIFSDGSKESIQFNDTMDWQSIRFKPRETEYFRFVIKDIYQGTKYDDTCISEMKVRGHKIKP
jgi:hypothetical protein